MTQSRSEVPNHGAGRYTISTNADGLPIRVIDHKTGQIGTRVYDSEGHLLEETLCNGHKIKSRYDLQGRKTATIYPDGSKALFRYGVKHLEEVIRQNVEGETQYSHRLGNYDLTGFPLTQRYLLGLGTVNYTLDKLKIDHVFSRYYSQDEGSFNLDKSKCQVKAHTIKKDPLGRVVTISQLGRQISYTYDAWNRRLSKKVYNFSRGEWQLSQHHSYIYEGDKEIGVIDEFNGRLSQLKICAPTPINPGDQAVTYELKGVAYIPIYDKYGNVHKLVSVHTREEIERYHYTQSGCSQITNTRGYIQEKSKVSNPWRFKSLRVDEETDLIFMDGDYYDPAIRNFVGNMYKKVPPFEVYQIPPVVVKDPQSL